MKIIRFSSKKLEKIYNRGFIRQVRVEEKVKKIIDDVSIDDFTKSDCFQGIWIRMIKNMIEHNKLLVRDEVVKTIMQMKNIPNDVIETDILTKL